MSDKIPDGVMPLRPFHQIQIDVGTWSAKNFGMQETPYLAIFKAGTIRAGRPRQKTDRPGSPRTGKFVTALDSLAPLLGIVEEAGELAASTEPGDKRDAIGDIAIYLCDYLFREEKVWPIRLSDRLTQYTPHGAGLVVCIGQLCRCHLKRHQRIRDMEDDRVFEAAQQMAIEGLVWHLNAVASNNGWNLLEILNFTWISIVAKRDWRKDAEGGGGHKHEKEGEAPNLRVVRGAKCNCAPSERWKKENPGQEHLRGCPAREDEKPEDKPKPE